MLEEGVNKLWTFINFTIFSVPRPGPLLKCMVVAVATFFFPSFWPNLSISVKWYHGKLDIEHWKVKLVNFMQISHFRQNFDYFWSKLYSKWLICMNNLCILRTFKKKFIAPWLRNLVEYSFFLPKYSIKISREKKRAFSFYFTFCKRGILHVSLWRLSL